MGNVRECFVCSMLLARLDRNLVEVYADGGKVTSAEVCGRCHFDVMGQSGMDVERGGTRYHVRFRPRQRDLFPAASHENGGGHGRPA